METAEAAEDAAAMAAISWFRSSRSESLWADFLKASSVAEAAVAAAAEATKEPLGVSGLEYDPSYLSCLETKSDLILAFAITAAILGS